MDTMIAKSSFAIAGGLSVCIPLLMSCGDQAGPAEPRTVTASTAGCADIVEPIKENPDFVPFESRMTQTPADERWSIGQLPERGILPGQIDSEAPALDGLPAVAAEIVAGDYYTVAYGEQAPQGTQSEFLKAGGIVLEVTPAEKGDETSTSIARDLYNDSNGDGQIVLVEVGAYEAAVSWADPDENGVREHHVLWTDGSGRDVNLYGVRGAEELVGLARDMVCQ